MNYQTIVEIVKNNTDLFHYIFFIHDGELSFRKGKVLAHTKTSLEKKILKEKILREFIIASIENDDNELFNYFLIHCMELVMRVIREYENNLKKETRQDFFMPNFVYYCIEKNKYQLLQSIRCIRGCEINPNFQIILEMSSRNVINIDSEKIISFCNFLNSDELLNYDNLIKILGAILRCGKSDIIKDLFNTSILLPIFVIDRVIQSYISEFCTFKYIEFKETLECLLNYFVKVKNFTLKDEKFLKAIDFDWEEYFINKEYKNIQDNKEYEKLVHKIFQYKKNVSWNFCLYHKNIRIGDEESITIWSSVYANKLKRG